MKVKDFFRSKIILFIIQILILTILIFFFHYQVDIIFDDEVSIPQKLIIQIIGNYVLFNNASGMVFIYTSWIVISFIPDFLHNNFRKAYSTNLTTFFFPNFFVYTFLFQHSLNYFNSHFLFHFTNTIFIGLIITLISLVVSLLVKKIRKAKPDSQKENLHIIANQIISKCPNCGTQFDSTPIYCYKCNSKLILETEENVEFQKK